MRITEINGEGAEINGEGAEFNLENNEEAIVHVDVRASNVSISTKIVVYGSGALMLCVGTYCLYNDFFAYPQYKQQRVDAKAALSDELRSNATFWQSQIYNLTQSLAEITGIQAAAVATESALYRMLSNIKYNWFCPPGPYQGSYCHNFDPSILSPTGSGVCSDRISPSYPIEQGPQDGGACMRYGSSYKTKFAPCLPSVNGTDPCQSSFPGFISAVASVTQLDQKLDSYNLELTKVTSLLDQTNTQLDQITNYIEDDGDFYGALGNATTFYAICLAFGEFVPAVIILITILRACFRREVDPAPAAPGAGYGALTESSSPPSALSIARLANQQRVVVPLPLLASQPAAVVIPGHPAALAAIAATSVSGADVKASLLNTNKP